MLPLEEGRVYRAAELEQWTTHASRTAKRLVEKGELTQVGPGMYARLRRTKFGPVPPTGEALMRAYLKGRRFLFTGPEKWNALRLGTTAVFAKPLVYTDRPGRPTLGNRTFWLRRKKFPDHPAPEWYAVDLLENAELVGASANALTHELATAFMQGRLDPEKTKKYAFEYGTKKTRQQVLTAAARARQSGDFHPR
jgi:hypothetical protein